MSASAIRKGGERAAGNSRRAAHSAAPGDVLFVGYLILITVEYTGLSNEFPLLKTIRFSTLLAYGLLIATIAQIGISGLLRFRQTQIFTALTGFTALSVLWAVVQTYAFNTIRDFVDGTVLFAVTALLVNSRKRVDHFCWMCLSVAVVLVVRNLNELGNAARASRFSAGTFMIDGNDFAWGLVVFLPFVLNLALGHRGIGTRAISLLAGAICLVGVVGTGSRGATLGLAAACLYYWVFETRRKFASAAVIAAVALGVVALAPGSYITRIQAIDDYSEDSSSQARLQTWGAGFKMAVDYPLGVGAGNFAAAYGRYYIPAEGANRITWAGGRWLSAHSIYFRTLGEYGFVGLGLLLWLIGVSVRSNLRVRGRLRESTEEDGIAAAWPSLLNTALIGYAVCGVFLSGLTYPHLFILIGLTVATQRIAGQQRVSEPRGRGSHRLSPGGRQARGSR